MADESAAYSADPHSFEAKVERSRKAVEATVEHIAEHKPSVRARQSPIATLLEPHEKEIRSALKAGWTAGAIARTLHDKGMDFSADSIRLRIAKMFATDASGKPKHATSGAVKRIEAPPQHPPVPMATAALSFANAARRP